MRVNSSMQLKQDMPSPDVAVQFLRTVVSSDVDVRTRPMDNPTVEDIHLHTLKTQIKDTAKIGRDSGILKIRSYMLHPLMLDYFL